MLCVKFMIMSFRYRDGVWRSPSAGSGRARCSSRNPALRHSSPQTLPSSSYRPIRFGCRGTSRASILISLSYLYRMDRNRLIMAANSASCGDNGVEAATEVLGWTLRLLFGNC